MNLFGNGTNIHNMNVNFNMNGQQMPGQFGNVNPTIGLNGPSQNGQLLLGQNNEVEAKVSNVLIQFAENSYITDDGECVLSSRDIHKPVDKSDTNDKLVNVKLKDDKAIYITLLKDNTSDYETALFVALRYAASKLDDNMVTYLIVEEIGAGDIETEPMVSSIDKSVVLFSKTVYMLRFSLVD